MTSRAKKTDEAKTSLAPGAVRDVAGMAPYGEQSIVSRTIVDRSAGTVTLFAFDAGQGLSEHQAPYDALVHVIEGQAVVVIGGVEHRLGAGCMILMPANVPHAVRADGRFKMLLTMIRQR